METDKATYTAISGDWWLYFFKDLLILALTLTIIGAVFFSFIESENIRAGNIPEQTVQIERLWAESRGFGTSYYALIDGESVRLYPGEWFGTQTARGLFLNAQTGVNCAVITSDAIRQIYPGHCP